ncbi:MAG: YceI family protein, partial [Thermodesulfobacteriota bacterium]
AAEIRGACDVRFLGTSTLHDFNGTGKCLPFAATLERAPGGGSVLPLVKLDVPVGGMDTENDSRDREMRKMFRDEQHPFIHASARDVDIDAVRRRMKEDAAGKAPLDVFLEIRGMERKIAASAGGLKEEGNRVSFDVEFPVSLKQFGLKAPSVLGLIRVGDRVLVKASFRVEIQETP